MLSQVVAERDQWAEDGVSGFITNNFVVRLCLLMAFDLKCFEMSSSNSNYTIVVFDSPPFCLLYLIFDFFFKYLQLVVNLIH